MLAALATILLAPAPSIAQSQADPLARLSAAHEANTLVDPALKPWHMLASFDLLDAKGNPTEHGTLEEWWATPERWHRRIISPSSNEDTYRVQQQFSSAPGRHLSYFVNLLPSQLTNPVAAPLTDGTEIVTAQTHKFGPTQLDCLLPQSAKTKSAPTFGTTPTYCLDPGRPTLRAFMEHGVQDILRNRLGTFQGKSVAQEVIVAEAGHPTLRATIEKLQGGPVADADLTPPPGMSVTTAVPRLGSGVMAGLKISGSQPTYPVSAKTRHISGSVLLLAVIGKDGHIHSLEPIYSPDPSLTDASTAAVRTWTYKPYLLDGQPVEVETTITVNFRIGG